jgi:hypothetical protein
MMRFGEVPNFLPQKMDFHQEVTRVPSSMNKIVEERQREDFLREAGKLVGNPVLIRNFGRAALKDE